MEVARPKTIIVFRNGDVHHRGERLQLRNIRNMSQLMDLVNREVRLVTGGCRKLVSPKGKATTTLEGFVDGGKYIALAGEPLNKERMSRHIEAASAESSRKRAADAPRHGNIVDRLTDSRLYTGAHKERFDADGQGRGLAGRQMVDNATQDLSNLTRPGM
eukprot:gnl/Trimastix_PCT/356.p1 GENE.gnl/Trimastix_PCT/356~~gnl/Trimastix_PCT/356.p1  ORF type:complete len:160 (+),score=45.81 gnl/Trimastix_PCT/356:64-543(+)